MEFDDDNVRRRVVEEDRLSSLPDELIHKILSCFDIKFVVQTCLLSSRWEYLWTSMPCLNFSSFSPLPKFAKFMTNVLSHRNHQVEVSSVNLDFHGAASQVFVKKIAKYAFSHNVQQLTVVCFPKKHHQYPSCLFSSKSLQHFTLSNHPFSYAPCLTPKTPWDFPALTTLHLSHITLCDDHTEKSVDLFSKCVNLKNLTLKRFTVMDVEVFDIITPLLSNLVLIDCRRSISINLIAPQLENLTVLDCAISYLNVPAGVSSLCYRGYDPRKLSKDRFHSLNKVSICLSMYKSYKAYEEEDAIETINMLQELHCARYLTLSVDIVECLSSFPDLVSHHPSPFSNLNCLTIDSSRRSDAYKVKMSTEVRNFLLENSPKAIFTMELPEEPPTKAMKQKEARVKRKAKLAAEIESDMKDLQGSIEQGNMIVDQKEKAKAAFDNIISISSKKSQIRSLLEKLPKRDRVELEARFSLQLEEEEALRGRLLSEIVNSEEDRCAFEKLISDYLSSYDQDVSDSKLPPGSQMPSSSSTSGF
ncbi:hypothetical protein Lser_V15G10538 [Lactuca serriola]